MLAASSVHVGDVVKMKKAHPCGSDEWEITRTGMDFGMKCCGCGHFVMLSFRSSLMTSSLEIRPL